MARATATAATATAAYRPGASTVTTLMMVPAVCAVTMLADLRLAGCRREGYRVRKLAALARDRARDDAVRNHGVFWNVITGLGRQHARPGPARPARRSRDPASSAGCQEQRERVIMVQRQLPRPAEIFELVRFKKPGLDAKKRRLEAALTIYDLCAIARRRTPKAAFDYTEGAAEEEISLARARQAFRDIEFRPSILRGAAEADTSCEIFGGPSALPFGIAPTGFTRLMQTEGEIAGASAAGAAGIPFCLSTLGTTSIEGVKAANPAGRNWFQLYVMRDREISYGLTRRAAAAGFDTLLFTVDAPVAGARLRDKRNGFSIPPQLTLGTIVNAIPRPRWWIDFLTTPKLEFASLTSTGGTVGELLDAAMDPTISFADLDVIRSLWPGKIVVKGVQNVQDARKLTDLGVTGIVLSNHGGRQLDRAPVPFRLLPEVVREVGKDVEIAIDTGIMSGADIVASIALGAKFTLIGRAYLYGLMAGGREGVDRMIAILRDQIERTMKLLGVATLAELTPGHVTQLARACPVPSGTAGSPG
jgi:L-lactate dehydrogenase (cytochrome)